MTRKRSGKWTTILETAPVAFGLAGAVIVALEGRLSGLILVLMLVATHRYASQVLDRIHISSDLKADWKGVRALTTVSCLALPFYLWLTRG